MEHFKNKKLIKANPYPYIKFLKMLRSFPFRAFFSTKKLYYADDARRRLLEGINMVCKTTQITLGPKVFLQLFTIIFNNFFSSKGRNVALENELGLPKITKDGVTVAKSIQFVPHFILNDS